MCMRGPLAEPPKDAMPKKRPVRWCWHGAECKWLAQRLCLFMHTEQEQRDVPLPKDCDGIFRRIEEARAKICILRNAVIRLAASIMWERGAVQAEFVQVTQRECVQARTSEQSLPIPVPPANQDIAEVVQALPPRARSKTNRGTESEYTEIGREKRRSTCIDQRRAS